MSEKIEIQKLTPVISTVSSGKSSFLNVICNFDILQVSPGIVTKYVNIIRYNPNVGNNPKFYHLIVKKEGDGKEYQFFKELRTVIEGRENIKKRINEINENLGKNEVPYEDIFYMIEVGELGIIKDEEYLKNYALVDIPGLSEYIPTKEENLKNSDKKEIPSSLIEKKTPTPNKDISIEDKLRTKNIDKVKNYITGIFKIIKNKIDNGIIMFDAGRIMHEVSYKIIGDLYLVLNKPIKNYLILLGEFFNFTNNTLVPYSNFLLKYEIEMGKSFEHLLNYHFYNFSMKSKSKTENKGESFIEYLNNLLTNLEEENILAYKKNYIREQIEMIIGKSNFSEILNNIKETIKALKEKNKKYNLDLGIDENDFDKDIINKIPEDLKRNDDEDSESSDDENDDKANKKMPEINIEDFDGNITILLFYNKFIEGKYIPPISKENTKIINYFTMKNMLEKEEEILEKNEDDSTNKKIENILKKLDSFYEKYKDRCIKSSNQKTLFERNKNSAYRTLKNAKYFYIPIIGLNNAGKSTILNNLIGYQLLPNSNDETTKRGILIKYWEKDFPAIYKTKFKKEKDYYYFDSGNLLAKGVKNVFEILEGVNKDFINNEENFFYEIYTKIKFIDEFKYDNKLKNQICFIDLPGFGTNNNFESNDTYSHLMQCCKVFLFIFRNLIIKESSNRKMINKLYKSLISCKNNNDINDSSISTTKSFINKCYFIINCEEDQKISDKFLDKAKDDIKILNKRIDKNNINISFFNAEFYKNYIESLSRFEPPEKYIELELKSYNDLKENIYKGLENKNIHKTFCDYLKKKLKSKFQKIKKTTIKENEKLKENLKKFFEKNKEKIKDKYIEKIQKFLLLEKEELKNSHYFSESNYEDFSKDLDKFIKMGNKKREKEILNDLNEPFYNLDVIFDVSLISKKQKLEEKPKEIVQEPQFEKVLDEFQKDLDDVLKKIDKDYKPDNKKYNIITDLLEECIEELRNTLNSEKKKYLKEEKEIKDLNENNLKQTLFSSLIRNLSWLFSNNWKEIQDQFEECFNEQTKNLKDNLIKCINNYSENIENHYKECVKYFENIEKYLDIHPLEKDITKFEDYLSKKIDSINNTKINYIVQEIIDDIKEGSRECTSFEKSPTILDWIKNRTSNSLYLYEIIKFMIDNSMNKFNELKKKIDIIFTEYHQSIKDRINIRKNKIIDILKEKKEKEENEINILKAKNDEEKEKWEEKKRNYEKDKNEWENICQQYKDIKDEMDKIIDTIKEI